ncbi:TMEM175 family protein [Methanobrevibacter wolinii]|nr:TMEM175 family protein [Methanobrevibacter wolinii]
METERFEALIDAILAIIITLIVLEFNLPNSLALLLYLN